ncbi:SDR family oxidoreductase [Nocardioides piscis]|uniref:SDR family oxidoreductase n=1 Tax=Nocardioides piscis TaxID=2714938 RepID=A0A6G7YDM4_9ACTN|nr:SDR family oxidoreductase [Nocardioides piscis]QIK74738.1 SDR family oxidoreductase [Nocardioides piscis]
MLVTGGAAGIAVSVARLGIARDWDVVVLSDDRASVGTSVRVNLTNTDEVNEALESVLHAGRVTRLVNSVHPDLSARLEGRWSEDNERIHQQSVQLAVQCARAVLPGMTSSGFGRIVSVSAGATPGKERRTAYAPSEPHSRMMDRTWALELGHHGVSVHAIKPGPVAIDLHLAANARASSLTHATAQKVVTLRRGSYEDDVPTPELLCADATALVTRQVLYACGGLRVRLSSV